MGSSTSSSSHDSPTQTEHGGAPAVSGSAKATPPEGRAVVLREALASVLTRSRRGEPWALNWLAPSGRRRNEKQAAGTR